MKYQIGNICDQTLGHIAIAHQCNCTIRGTNVKGIAKAIFAAYPYSDIYRDRQTNSEPGTAIPRCKKGEIHDLVNVRTPMVLALMGQFHPGPCRKEPDSPARRLGWMRNSLIAMGATLDDYNIKDVAVPYGIGCGLAGGRWSEYRNLLLDFEGNHRIGVTVVILPEFQHLLEPEEVEHLIPNDR